MAAKVSESSRVAVLFAATAGASLLRDDAATPSTEDAEESPAASSNQIDTSTR
jgi:hypothetical protein